MDSQTNNSVILNYIYAILNNIMNKISRQIILSLNIHNNFISQIHLLWVHNSSPKNIFL